MTIFLFCTLLQINSSRVITVLAFTCCDFTTPFICVASIAVVEYCPSLSTKRKRSEGLACWLPICFTSRHCSTGRNDVSLRAIRSTAPTVSWTSMLNDCIGAQTCHG